MGKVKRDASWNKPARITELISSFYTAKSSKLHYGFLQEHGNSFFRIISANLSVNKDNSVFLPSLSDPVNHPMDDTITSSDILAVYIRSHQNDLSGSPMPETGKYPPTNETMMISPPTLREWKSSQQHHFNIFNSNSITPTGPTHTAVSSSSVHHDDLVDDLVAITFKANWDDKEEFSVMIDDNLTVESTMEEIMVDGDVFAELASVGNKTEIKYLIQKRGGGKITLKWDKFKRLSMKNVMSIKNVHEDYMVVIVE